MQKIRPGKEKKRSDHMFGSHGSAATLVFFRPSRARAMPPTMSLFA
jgi:hypothetical protein